MGQLFIKHAFVIISILYISSFLGCQKPLDKIANQPLISSPLGPKVPLHQEKHRMLSGDQCIPINPAGKIEQRECREGFLCVPNTFNPKLGTCLIECGKSVDNHLLKNPAACPSSYKCVKRRDAELKTIGMFCIKPQLSRDMPCEAPFDKDSCGGLYNCLPTSAEKIADKEIKTRYRCKLECSVENPCMLDAEQCLELSFSRTEVQKNRFDNRNSISCDVDECEKNSDRCSCDKALGFSCKSSFLGSNIGTCMRNIGLCGEAISWANPSDFRGKDFVGESCNELEGHRFCQNPFLVDNNKNAMIMCKKVSRAFEGICLGVCSSPRLENNDAIRLQCPAGFSCNNLVSRALNFFRFSIQDGAYKGCDPSKCEENKPCPSECGEGDGECLSIGQGESLRNICGAPFGTCEKNE